ncbi:response regulator [Paenibacillus sp. sgz302251]|uniref:response regulator n=1 Tax=Paenibacillus sp. sgz302251 TaxID=3414493 RepID=UPI003C7BEACB
MLIKGGESVWVLKLIVVDDNISDLEGIRQIADSISFVEWGGSFAKPQEALMMMMRNAPDVLITAVELPEMNGLSFTGRLQECLPRVHVIVAARSGQYAREAFEVGARGYLIKPFEKGSLLRLLGNVTK